MNEVEALKLAPEFSTSEERRVLAEDALTLKCSRTSCAEPTVHLLAGLVLDMADELAEVRAERDGLEAALRAAFDDGTESLMGPTEYELGRKVLGRYFPDAKLPAEVRAALDVARDDEALAIRRIRELVGGGES